MEGMMAAAGGCGRRPVRRSAGRRGAAILDRAWRRRLDANPQAPVSLRMPREGSRTLFDLRSPVLRISRGRSGRHSVARLWRERGDLRLTDFLAEPTADCERRKGPAIYDRCDARFEF
jgi:hypothetical protein